MSERDNEKTASARPPKVLVVSFNCFLSSGANGRTLQNLFYGWDRDCLAQFYMGNEVPDFDGCGRYYRVTDNEALKALLGKRVGRTIDPAVSKADDTGKVYSTIKTNRKNQAIRYFRQRVWETGRWQNKAFWRWIDEFAPDLILLFSGNNAFIDKIAFKIAKRRSIPIVLYNCEDYYLKGPKDKTLFAKINKRHNDKIFERTMARVRGVMYNSELLRDAYWEALGAHNSLVVYNPASPAILAKRGRVAQTDAVAYLGNIAVGRDDSLIEVARALRPHGRPLHIYGGTQTDAIRDRLQGEPNIVYHGKVGYDECVDVMCGCRLLIHCESFAPEHTRDLRFAFSTKIADSLASGTGLFVYAPGGIALTEYLLQTKSAVVVTDPAGLETALDRALSADAAGATVAAALAVAAQNHDIERSAQAVREFLAKAASPAPGADLKS